MKNDVLHIVLSSQNIIYVCKVDISSDNWNDWKASEPIKLSVQKEGEISSIYMLDEQNVFVTSLSKEGNQVNLAKI